MNKKRKIRIILALLIIFLFTIFMIVRRNIGFPQKEKIEEIGLNEYIDCGQISIKVMDKKIERIDSSEFPIGAVTFKIKNNQSRPLDISYISDMILLYSDFSGSIIQNIDRGFGGNDDFENFYSKEDLKLKANQEKEFVFNCYLFKEVNKYKNFIYLENVEPNKV
ncbi:MAG: hypothetical protein PUG67_00965 [Peptoniphilaceae bacterium]|nr:hypothetical protein [Peptoniphilaceae bacterium]MDY6018625.1 hypothetical protein [Anaerococcus sp.]